MLVTWFGENTADGCTTARAESAQHASKLMANRNRSAAMKRSRATLAMTKPSRPSCCTWWCGPAVTCGGDGLRARTVSVRIRDADFKDRRASRTIDTPIESDRAIYQTARKLLTRLRSQRRMSARLLSVSLSNLTATDGPAQLGLFAESAGALETERDRKVARVMDDVRGRFGSGAIVPGRILPSP